MSETSLHSLRGFSARHRGRRKLEDPTLTSGKTKKSSELRELIEMIEKLQAKAVRNGDRFLAYLLDMARMEAVSLLKREDRPLSESRTP